MEFNKSDLPSTLFILKSTDRVLFPKMMLPYPIVNKSLLDIIKTNKYIGIMYDSDKSKVGTVGEILEISEVQNGANILVQGLSRFSKDYIVETNELYIKAYVTYKETTITNSDEVKAMKSRVLALFNKINRLSPSIPRDVISIINTINNDTSMICDMIVASSDTDLDERQSVLNELELSKRMKVTINILNSKLNILEIGTKIDKETRGTIDKANRDFYLRRQRDEINKQLGEEDNKDEVEEYKNKIEAKGLPQEVLDEANRELRRMERMHSASHEYSVVATYLDWILDLPWNDSTEDNVDIKVARDILEADHYGLKKPKKRILEFLAVKKLKDKSRTPILCFIGPPGVGKAQPLDVNILTPKGFIKMGDIAIDDYIVTPSGKYSKVIGTFPQGKKDIYKVVFSDGSFTQCCREHLWKVQNREDRINNRYRTIELDYMIPSLFLGKDKRKNYSIDTVDELDLVSNKYLEIDPYLLGFFISDGHGKRRSISKIDKETISLVSETLSKIGCKLSRDSKKDYRIVKIEHNCSNNINKHNNKSKFHIFLEKSGLINCLAKDKFIPKEYLLSSYKNREYLLQGIMDGDGSPVRTSHSIEWSSASKKLSDDVIFLVQSLGGMARYSIGTSFYTYNEKKLKGANRHRLRITFPVNVRPFRCSKKFNIYNSNLDKKKDLKRFVSSIKFIGVKETKCILIDDPNHLYITDNFIVTHNTSLGKSIAQAINRKFYRMSLGGIRDEADVRGHRRTYIGAMPGRIIQSIKRAGSNNPLIMLDEIDKIGSDHRGDPSSALLEALDPEQNYSFSDHYLNVPFDLSKVMFITTANTLSTIQPALRDRMEVIELHGYSQYEKIEIAKRFLIPRQIEEHGLNNTQISFSEGALDEIINAYTMEAGVRNLEREIANVCRGLATKIVESGIESEKITKGKVNKYLDVPKFKTTSDIEITKPGISTVLYASSLGGGIDLVETVKFKREGKAQRITTSGSVGDVIKESVGVALSWIKENIPTLLTTISEYDVHIHFPSGATPKDGPSAGIALVTALVSLFKNIKVKSNLAMTGEMTLRGKVLEIGGVKHKVLAAHRANIKDIILPKWNEKNLKDLPSDVLKDITFHFVDNIHEVLNLTFEE